MKKKESKLAWREEETFASCLFQRMLGAIRSQLLSFLNEVKRKANFESKRMKSGRRANGIALLFRERMGKYENLFLFSFYTA